MKTYFVVTAVLHFNGKMLILKKAPDDWNYPNYWSLCSGFIKEFEAAEDTVLREIKEETGLDASIEKCGRIIEVLDSKKEKKWVVSTFLCNVNSDKVVLDHENSDYRWITKEELPDFQFVPGIIDDLRSVGLL